MAQLQPNWKIRLLAGLIYGLLRLIYSTCKCCFLGDKDLPKEPSLVLFWHSRLAFMGFLFALMRQRGYTKTPYVLISPHKDGMLISAVIRHFGIQTVQGSTNKEPIKALLAIRRILASGNDVFITPDGPRGPAKSLSAGSVYIANKFACKLAIISNSASKVWRFNSWDRMILPKPFCKVCFSIKSNVNSDIASIQSAFAELESLQAKAGFYA